MSSTNGHAPKSSPNAAIEGGVPSQVVPHHIAIIMDGNGRWANSRGLPRIEGHRAGAKSVRTIVEAARKLGVRYLTLFSFSTENWRRSTDEVGALMKLFRQYLDSELETLLKNDIRLRAIGELERLPTFVRESLEATMIKTENRSGMDLVLAMSYGGREDILQATRKIAEKVQSGSIATQDIDQSLLEDHLWTKDIPNPDLLIRTSGETRISNFFLFQLAYTEIVIVKKFWPDFDEAAFLECVSEFNLRERRFGQESARQVAAGHPSARQ